MKVVAIIILIRILTFLLLSSSYHPDEYYQYNEPAYSLVFLQPLSSSLTWEWREEYQIRSFVSLIPLTLVYSLLKMFRIDYPIIIRNTPRLLQSLFTMLSDVMLYVILKQRYSSSSSVPYYTILTHLLSWMSLYCFGRTLANNNELILQTLGLLLWSSLSSSSSPTLSLSTISTSSYSSRLLLIIVSLSIYIRPTALIWWLILIYFTIINENSNFSCLSFSVKTVKVAKMIMKIVLQSLTTMSLVVVLCILYDTYCYGYYYDNQSLVIPPYNFIKANIINGYAMKFGTTEWYWPIVQGFPFVLGLYTPVVIYGLTTISMNKFARVLISVSIIYGLTLRLMTSHLEHRFYIPCLPAFHVVVGEVIETLVRNNNHHRKQINWKQLLLILIPLIHICLSVFLLTSHQIGSEQSMIFLERHINRNQRNHNRHHVSNVYVMEMCYTFPGYTYMHSNTNIIKLYSLHCSPLDDDDTNSNEKQSLIHIYDKNRNNDKNNKDDNYILTYDSSINNRNINSTVNTNNFKLIGTFRHAYFKYDYDDENSPRYVYVYKQQYFVN